MGQRPRPFFLAWAELGWAQPSPVRKFLGRAQPTPTPILNFINFFPHLVLERAGVPAPVRDDCLPAAIVVPDGGAEGEALDARLELAADGGASLADVAERAGISTYR